MNKRKKVLSVVLAAMLGMVMCFGSIGTAFAAEGDAYLALGSSLDDSEKATVLNLLGVSDTNDYNIIYVTNQEEHKYLDGSVDSNQIGSRALSSILIRETGGSDITVETHNIGFCTSEMYKNALATAGVTGADVKVAGPFEISGTAALVGIIKAYEEMTGKDVSDEVIEGSVDELNTTGELGEEIGDKDTAAEIMSDVKEEMAENPNMSAEEIKEAINEAASDHGVTLSEETLNSAQNTLENLQGLNIDWDNINLGKAQGLFNRFVNWVMGLFN